MINYKKVERKYTTDEAISATCDRCGKEIDFEKKERYSSLSILPRNNFQEQCGDYNISAQLCNDCSRFIARLLEHKINNDKYYKDDIESWHFDKDDDFDEGVNKTTIWS